MNRGWLLALLPWLVPVQAANLEWAQLRDAALYVQPRADDTLSVSWTPAWQAAANGERLYLLDGHGRLVGDRPIPASETRGAQRWALTAAAGPYRLEVPGYSFRGYRVHHLDTTSALLAPAKVHVSAEVGPAVTLYFRVPAGATAVLAGKYQGGVGGLEAQRLSDGRARTLPLKPYPAYWQFDQLTLPGSDRDETWQLRLLGQGKAAFWLDGVDNLFAQRAEHLGPLTSAAGNVRLRLHDRVLGPTPRLGVALPYVMPPADSFPALNALAPQAASFYTFADVLARQPQAEDPWRRLYRGRFGIDQDVTLLAATGRRAELTADRTSVDGLDAWLAATVRLEAQTGATTPRHYLAFADEPNLNYRDFATFERFFTQQAARVRAFPGAHEAGVRIAMPASSRWLGGPFTEQSERLRGIDWARRLLQQHADQIDAVAWHEWMVRDLLATRSYRDSVRAAAELVGLNAQGRPRKALLLDQTNLSSGATLSPYEQNTHYASLWWASVVINASADGLLDVLNWFHVADEPAWPKGMVRQTEAGRFELKPVGRAQQFIRQQWLTQVLALDNDAFEVDALAMGQGRQRSVLGVNKVERLQHVTLALDAAPCADLRLALFGADSQPRSAPVRCQAGHVFFDLPGQTLFALTWTASHDVAALP